MNLDEPSLPEIVALQLGGNWSEALSRLAAIRGHHVALLCEANRAVCLFHLKHFEKAASLAPALARIYPKELLEYDVNRLMMTLLVLAMVAHHHVGNNAEACRLALELYHHFDWKAGDLPFIPTAIFRNEDGTLTIHELSDGRVIVFVLFCLQFEPSISEAARQEMVVLLETYARLDPSEKTVQEVVEEVLFRDDIPIPHIDFDAVPRRTRRDTEY